MTAAQEALGQHILVVDDDAEMRLMLRRCLEQEGYRVTEAENRNVVMECLNRDIDLITLDLKLRHDDGLSIARDIRSNSNVPIIMVTAKDDPVDRIVGLEIGADDYIVKPFHIREVLARVRSVLRRTSGHRQPENPAPQAAGPEIFSFAGWTVDFAAQDLRSLDGSPCKMTAGQMKLLELFARNPNKVLSRDRIMDLLKGYDWTPSDRSVDNQIVRLRRAIEEDPRRPQIIKTVHGAGYKFAADLKPANKTS